MPHHLHPISAAAMRLRIVAPLLVFVLLLTVSSQRLQAGLWFHTTEIAVDTGSGTQYYWGTQGSSSGVAAWNNRNLGTYNLLGGSTFTLKGGGAKMSRDNNDYVNSNNNNTINYSLYQSSASSWSTYAIAMDGNYLGSNTPAYQGYNSSGTTNLGSSLTTSGTWYMAVYWTGTGSWWNGSQQFYNLTADSNSSNNYVANITAFYGATATGTQASAFTGSGYFNFNGSGNTYTLNAANTYTGQTQIDAGTVQITSTGSLSSSSDIYIGNGGNSNNGQLTLNGTTSSFGNFIQFNSGSGTRTLQKEGTTNQTLSGNMSLQKNSLVNVLSTGNLTASGNITCNANTVVFEKGGSGNLILSGNSGFNGQYQIANGTLIVSHNNGVGTNTGTSTRGVDLGITGVSSTATADTYLLVTNGITLNNSIYVAPNTASNYIRRIGLSGTGSGTFSNEIYNDAALSIDGGSGNVTVSGNIINTGAVTIVGGNITLSGSNTYDGATTISSGTLNIATVANGGATSPIGDSSNAAANLVIGSGTLRYTGSTASTDRAFTISAGTTATVDVTTSGQTLAISGAAANTSGALTKAGSGGLTLSGANSFTGATTINAGTLTASAANALQSTSGITVNSAAILLVSASNSINNSAGITLTSGTLRASGTTSDTVGALNVSTGTIDMGSGDADLTFASITDVSTSLAVHNYTAGTDTLSFTDNTSWTSARLGRVTFFSDAGSTTISSGAVVSGSQIVPAPRVTIAGSASSATSADFSTTYGTASANQTFAIVGSNLLSNITVNAGTGFEVSTDGTTYSSSVTFTNSSGSASGTLYVRLAANAVVTGTYTSATAATITATSLTSLTISTDSAGSSVSQKGLTITAISISDKVYDGLTTASIAGTAAYSGLANGESFSVTGTPAATFGNATVGSAKTVTITGYTAPNGNYSITQPSLTGNITTRSLTITANSTSKAFNNTLTTPATGQTTFTSSGLQNSETIGSVTLTYAGGYNATDAAGTYNIVPSAATGGNFTASNYAITYANGTLTVTAVAPSVTTGTAGSLSTSAATISSSNVTSDGGTSVTARGIAYATSATPTTANSTTSNGTGTGSFNAGIGSLAANTLYYFRAYATNSVGTSYGSESNFTTLPNAPTVGSASSITATGFTASWTAPSPAGSATYTYSLETSTDNSSFSSATTGIASSSTSQAVTGLSSGTTYYFRVRAVNAGGNSAYSSGSAAVLTTPAAPGTPSFSSVTSNSFTVTWSAATGAASYRLDVATDSGFSSLVSGYNNLTVASTSQAVTGLSAGTTYYARVRAVNASGTGANSTSASQATTTPGITINATTAVTSADFTTTYGTASSVQTFAIAGTNLVANITATAGTGFEVASDGATYGSTATFTNSGGSASGTLSVRLAATAPATGTYTSATVATMSSTSAVSRSVSTDSAGSAVSQKGLTITGISISDKVYDGLTAATIAGTAAYSGLANSESHTVTGTPSASFGTAAVGSAKSVTITGYTAPNGNYSISQPSLTGNITARSLTITANSTSKVFNNALTTPATAQTAFTSSGLQNSETIGSVTLTYAGGYNATDAAGTYNIVPSAATGGNFTASNYNITYANGTLTVTAIAPTLATPTATSIATTSATLGATVTSDGGAALSARGTVWGTSASPTTNSSAEGGTSVAAFSHSRTGLTANTLYYYRGYATNSAGTSYSADGTFTTLPNAPTVGSASSITATGFTAAWTAPTSMGSATYTYSLETSTDNSSFSSATTGISSSSTSQAVTGLSSGTTYYFRVRAVNAGGNSAYSSGSASVLTIPAAPGTPSFSSVTSNSFTVTWAAATGAASYRLDVDDNSDFSSPLAGYNDLTVASTSQAVTGLSAGTTYYARVRAVNASGTGANSSSGSQATTTPGITINTNTSATAADFITEYGTASANQSFTIAGTNLVADITATAGTGFEVSSDGTTYGSTATFTNSGGSASGTLRVRLAATAAAATSYLSATAATLSSTSATNRLISTDGVGSDVTQKALTITGLSAANKTYDGNATVSVTGTPAYSGLANGESFSVTGTVTWAFPNATVGTSKTLTRTGDYDAPSTNYTVTQPTLTANITARDITITASAQSKDYGATAPTSGTLNTNFTLSSGTLASGESISGATLGYSGSPAGNLATAAVGSYTITPSVLTISGGGASASNYNITYATGTLTVNARALSITATAQSKNFGDTLSGGSGSTAFTSSGLQNSETIGTVTIAYSGGTAADAAAGTYTITPSAATGGNFTASNYSITYNTGTLTVNAIAPTVTTGTSGSVTATGAVITGSNVTSAGGGTISARGVVYGTAASPTLGGGNTTVADGSNTTGTFNSTLTGLTGGVTYHVRAYVTTGHSTAYGTSISFTTSADVPAQVTLSRAHSPINGGFTVAWTDVANNTGYFVQHSTNSTLSSGVTTANVTDGNASSYNLTGLTNNTTYYVRVTAYSAGGNGTSSDIQVNTLRAIPAGATRYFSPPGTVTANTVDGIFGSNNEAGLATSTVSGSATVIMTVTDAGGTGATIFRHNSSGWLDGAAAAGSTSLPAGKAFILRNNTGSLDYILLTANPTTAPPEVSVFSAGSAAAGTVNLLTPASEVPKAIDALNLRTGNATTQVKAASVASQADLVIIPRESGLPRGYFHDGTVWRSAGGNTINESTITVPAGGGFFIRKGPGSTFQTYKAPSN